MTADVVALHRNAAALGVHSRSSAAGFHLKASALSNSRRNSRQHNRFALILTRVHYSLSELEHTLLVHRLPLCLSVVPITPHALFGGIDTLLRGTGD
jgi:hypothetical protein